MRAVKLFDVPSSRVTTIGYHSESEVPTNGDSKFAVSCVASVLKGHGSGNDIVASAGWDSNFFVWDARMPKLKSASSVKLPGKAFSMDAAPSSTLDRVVVGTAGRRLCIIDLKMVGGTGGATAKMILERESSLKYQTRTTRFFPDGHGLAVGSIEGRCAIEYLDEIGIDCRG